MFGYGLTSGYWNFTPPVVTDVVPITVVPKQAKVKVGNAEGYECSVCQDFFPMAELNQPDNAQDFSFFTCYGCRKGLRTIFNHE